MAVTAATCGPAPTCRGSPVSPGFALCRQANVAPPADAAVAPRLVILFRDITYCNSLIANCYGRRRGQGKTERPGAARNGGGAMNGTSAATRGRGSTHSGFYCLKRYCWCQRYLPELGPPQSRVRPWRPASSRRNWMARSATTTASRATPTQIPPTGFNARVTGSPTRPMPPSAAARLSP